MTLGIKGEGKWQQKQVRKIQSLVPNHGRVGEFIILARLSKLGQGCCFSWQTLPIPPASGYLLNCYFTLLFLIFLYVAYKDCSLTSFVPRQPSKVQCPWELFSKYLYEE